MHLNRPGERWREPEGGSAEVPERMRMHVGGTRSLSLGLYDFPDIGIGHPSLPCREKAIRCVHPVCGDILLEVAQDKIRKVDVPFPLPFLASYMQPAIADVVEISLGVLAW